METQWSHEDDMLVAVDTSGFLRCQEYGSAAKESCQIRMEFSMGCVQPNWRGSVRMNYKNKLWE